jgi:hypothetical protein
MSAEQKAKEKKDKKQGNAFGRLYLSAPLSEDMELSVK